MPDGRVVEENDKKRPRQGSDPDGTSKLVEVTVGTQWQTCGLLHSLIGCKTSVKALESAVLERVYGSFKYEEENVQEENVRSALLSKHDEKKQSDHDEKKQSDHVLSLIIRNPTVLHSFVWYYTGVLNAIPASTRKESREEVLKLVHQEGWDKFAVYGYNIVHERDIESWKVKAVDDPKDVVVTLETMYDKLVRNSRIVVLDNARVCGTLLRSACACGPERFTYNRRDGTTICLSGDVSNEAGVPWARILNALDAGEVSV